MDLAEAIRTTQQSLLDAREELSVHRDLVRTLEQDSKRLERELDGLRSAANRLGVTLETEDGGAEIVPISGEIELSSRDSAIPFMNRNDSVVAALAEIGRPADRTTIVEKLADHGRYESADAISLALSGLKRTNRVEKLGKGLWGLAEQDVRPSRTEPTPINQAEQR